MFQKLKQIEQQLWFNYAVFYIQIYIDVLLYIQIYIDVLMRNVMCRHVNIFDRNGNSVHDQACNRYIFQIVNLYLIYHMSLNEYIYVVKIINFMVICVLVTVNYMKCEKDKLDQKRASRGATSSAERDVTWIYVKSRDALPRNVKRADQREILPPIGD